MKCISWNVNGIRAAKRKGFLDWFGEQDADLVCLQEVKAVQDQLGDDLIHPLGYHSYWSCAERRGYSGVVIYSRAEADRVHQGFGHPEFDKEGRVVAVDLGELTVVNAYFPHSRHDLSRLDYKMDFNNKLLEWLSGLAAQGRKLVLCGDYNVSHQDIDLTNYKANRKNPGFLPVERDWMDRFLAAGFRDVFRDAHPDESGHHTWWSNRKGVRERNVGWRIDYHCISESLADRVIDVGHQTEVLGSDHCPIYLQLSC